MVGQNSTLQSFIHAHITELFSTGSYGTIPFILATRSPSQRLFANALYTCRKLAAALARSSKNSILSYSFQWPCSTSFFEGWILLKMT